MKLSILSNFRSIEDNEYVGLSIWAHKSEKIKMWLKGFSQPISGGCPIVNELHFLLTNTCNLYHLLKYVMIHWKNGTIYPPLLYLIYVCKRGQTSVIMPKHMWIIYIGKSLQTTLNISIIKVDPIISNIWVTGPWAY